MYSYRFSAGKSDPEDQYQETIGLAVDHILVQHFQENLKRAPLGAFYSSINELKPKLPSATGCGQFFSFKSTCAYRI